MECNRDEAQRAKALAENLLGKGDLPGCRRLLTRAESLWSELDGLKQLSLVHEVHTAASKKFGNDRDYYGILQVDANVDANALKKQYRKMALALHPDKNPIQGAEAAFKFVGEAFAMLSDKDKRNRFDLVRESRNRVNAAATMVSPGTNVAFRAPFGVNVRPPPNVAVRPGFGVRPPGGTFGGPPTFHPPRYQQARPDTEPSSSFWTKCPHCGLKFEFLRVYHNVQLPCTSCGQTFILRETPTFNVFKQGATSEFVNSAFQQAKQQREDKVRREKEDRKESQKTTKERLYRQAEIEAERMRRRSAGETSAAAATASESSPETNCVTNQQSRGEGVAAAAAAMPVKRSSKPRKRVKCIIPDQEEMEQEQEEQRKARKRRCVIEEDEDSVQGKAEVDVQEPEVQSEVRPRRVRRSSRRRNAPKYNYDDDLEEFPSKKADATTSIETAENGAEDEAEPDSSTKSGESLSVPDNVFHNFDEHRLKDLAPGQFWAAYDEKVAMPRFYCLISGVNSESEQVTVKWLEGDKRADPNVKWWRDMELYAGCGHFKLESGKSELAYGVLSHQIMLESSSGRGRCFVLYPKKGEVWCMYDGWSRDWESAPEENHREMKLSVVEVLTDFSKGTGGTVAPLTKVPAFKTVFVRQDAAAPIQVDHGSILSFSHMVPAFKLSGEDGQPDGWELDSASLSDNLLEEK